MVINVALVGSLTRNAWLGLLVGAGWLVWMRRRRLLLIALPAALAFVVLAPVPVLARALSVTNLSDESSYDRLCMLEAGARMVAEHPLFGIGPNMVERLYPIYRHATASRLNVPHLHDSYIQLAAERGLPALASYLALLAVALARAWRGYRSDLAAGHRAGEAGSRADLWLGVTAALMAFVGRRAVRAQLGRHRGPAGRAAAARGAVLPARSGAAASGRRARRKRREGAMSAGSGGGGARFARFLAEARAAVDGELDRLLPASGRAPERLHEAMRYSVFAGGKRLRPALVLLAGRSFGAPRPRPAGRRRGGRADPHLQPDPRRPAGARRRRPAPRPADAAPAVRRGDRDPGRRRPADARPDGARRAAARRCRESCGRAPSPWSATAIGTGGMIGGQAEDLAAEAGWPSGPGAAAAALDRIHRGKTGALLVASLRLGGIYAAATPAEDLILRDLGEAVGLLFQIRDDILDVEGSASALGKTPGKDAAASKLTYPALHGLDRSRERLKELGQEAMDRIADLPRERESWVELISFLDRRGY